MTSRNSNNNDVMMTAEEGNSLSPLQEPLLSVPEESEDAATTTAAATDDDDEVDTNNDTTQQSGGNEQGPHGTISSACFNMWSTMVGGGCLSLPLAFVKSGNALLAPLLLIGTAGLSYFCFAILVQSSRWSLMHTYEGLAASAAGTRYAHAAFHGCAILVFFMCWFAICGYAVLLRDMVEPLTHMLFHHHVHHDADHDNDHDTIGYWQNNALMFIIALVVTPICTLRTLTSLEKFGATSMSAVVLLGGCVVFRSGQCLVNNNAMTTKTIPLRLWPEHWKDVLDVLPLYISCYVCHYNIPIVLHELQDPTAARTNRWLLITVTGSTLFYLLLGLSGSMYALACHDGIADGNILLDFPEDDPLVLVGRLCLAVTIALAFPMLTIPARDILLRSRFMAEASAGNEDDEGEEDDANSALFDEPFLEQSLVDPTPFLPVTNDESSPPSEESPSAVPIPLPPTDPSPSNSGPSLRRRLLSAIIVLWTGVILASVVDSIDVVWDLLGSSLSILLSYLIPAAAFLVLVRSQRGMGSSKAMSYALIVLFVPLIVISTGNAIINTFL
jgi:amino acid permease